jgi:hypothetical protein
LYIIISIGCGTCTSASIVIIIGVGTSSSAVYRVYTIASAIGINQTGTGISTLINQCLCL